jgi:hypothetical protein
MYTGELLKSDTVNSISLLRTAAILSINSLNDLLLSSNSSSPNSLVNPHQLPTVNHNNNNHSSANNSSNNSNNHNHNNNNINGNSNNNSTNNNNNNNSNNNTTTSNSHNNSNNNNNIRPLATQKERISLVDQISPLFAAISQQQQHKLNHQAFGTNISSCNGNGGLGVPMNQNENITRNLSVSSHDSNSSTNSSNFNSLIGAAAAAAVASVNGNGGHLPPVGGGNSAVAQLYNNLNDSGPINSPTSGAAIVTSSSLSTPPSPINNRVNFNLPEPFAYSSAITGVSSVTTSTNINGSPGSQSAVTVNEYQFKCPVCQSHFQTICSFEYHMQRAHGVTSFGCEICHKPFASLRYVLTDHMRRCHGWKGAANNSNNNSPNSNHNNKNGEQDQQKMSQC